MFIKSWEKRRKNSEGAVVTDVELSQQKIANMFYGGATPANYSCSFNDNPTEFNQHWTFRNVK